MNSASMIVHLWVSRNQGISSNCCLENLNAQNSLYDLFIFFGILGMDKGHRIIRWNAISNSIEGVF